MQTTESTSGSASGSEMVRPEAPPASWTWRAWAALAFVVAVTAAMGQPLLEVGKYALAKDLHSHILLIPVIVGYLIHMNRESLRSADLRLGSAWVPGGLLLVAGGAIAAWAIGVIPWPSAIGLAEVAGGDRHALVTFGWVLLVWAGGFLLMGSSWMWAAVFPAAFLVFTVPLPDLFIDTIEHWLVLGSAEATALLLDLTGTTHFREGTLFQLSTITLEVARECSGIRSSYVLFITSILASYMLLESPWRRIVLVAFVIPLGIFRNGLRILTIALLCVHVGPHMVDSIVHTRGGPFFFGLSLIPLFALLWWLRRGERKRAES